MSDQSRRYNTAKINNDRRLVIGEWASQVFANLGGALAELAESDSPDLWMKIF